MSTRGVTCGDGDLASREHPTEMPNIGGWGFRRYPPLHMAIPGLSRTFIASLRILKKHLSLFAWSEYVWITDTLCRPAYHNTDTNPFLSLLSPLSL